jgi:hypothetical protein
MRLAAGLASTEGHGKKLFRAIDEIVKRDGNSEWSRDHAGESAAAVRLEYFRKMKDGKLLDAFVRKNLSLHPVREEAFARAFKSRDYVAARELALGGIAAAEQRNQRGRVIGWKKKILEIAVGENNKQEERMYARELFLDEHDFVYYGRYKRTFSKKEWKESLDRLIGEIERGGKKSRNRYALLPGIFIQEEKWNDLLEFVREHTSMEALEEYHRHLAGRFPSEIFSLYESAVRAMLAKNTGRVHYQRAARMLRKMKKLGRAKELKALVQDLNLRYKNRPVLLRELKSI